MHKGRRPQESYEAYQRRLNRERVRRHRKKKREAAKAATMIPLPAVDPTNEADVLIAWMETLTVPNGVLRGGKFQIADWQADFIRGCLAPEVKLAGQSISRKNLKTTTLAAILLCFTGGPLRRSDWSAIACSLTGKNIEVLKRQMKAIYRENRDKFAVEITFKETPKPGIVESDIGARVAFLAANRYAGGHSEIPSMVVVDEAGNFERRFVDLWSQLRTSLGATDGTMIAISNRGEFTPFSDIGKLYAAGKPHVFWQEFKADDNAKADDEEQWHKANPALATGAKSISYMRDLLEEAKANPSIMQEFRALEMNLPGSLTRDMIVSLDDWRQCEVDKADLPPRQGMIICGVDVGKADSLTAWTMLWPETGRFEAFVACCDDPDLKRRGEADGVGDAYQRMHERGELFLYPGRTTPIFEFFAEMETIIGGAPIHIGFDRVEVDAVHEAIHRLALNVLGFHRRGIGGTGYLAATGPRDVRAFQKAVRQASFKIKFNLAMREAIRLSEVKPDRNGNPILDKSLRRGRIDALQAAVIAFGIHEQQARQPELATLSYGVVH